MALLLFMSKKHGFVHENYDFHAHAPVLLRDAQNAYLLLSIFLEECVQEQQPLLRGCNNVALLQSFDRAAIFSLLLMNQILDFLWFFAHEPNYLDFLLMNRFLGHEKRLG